MTIYSTVRAALEKRARYNRTVRALSALPAEFAIEDLGIYPGDAARIAHEAVYGK